VSELVWSPSPEQVARANVTRLMGRAGTGSLAELRRRSCRDPAWFWDLVVEDLGIPFATPYREVLDESAGMARARWFLGGRVNLAAACLERRRGDPAEAARPALIAEAEDGAVRTLTYAELTAAVEAAAAGLRALGIGPGDAVGCFMPMIPEAVIAAYAIAWVGAVYVPVFSGFAGPAIASRLDDAGARAVLAARRTSRRGRPVDLWPPLRDAVAACPSVERVVLVGAEGDEAGAGDWGALLGGPAGPGPPHVADAEEPWLLGYTSGTTGRPKGAVHVHGGFLVKIAAEVAYQVDLHPGERLLWLTDMGWIMGPWSMVGAHANGGAMVMYEGAPDHPDPRRIFDLAARHEAAVLGVSPTLIRSLRARIDGPVWAGGPPPALRILASTGEPWDEAGYAWLAREVGGGELPVINLSGGTEVGACFLSPHPVEPLRPRSLGGPALGMDVAVFDPAGEAVVGEVGELVCRRPWPGMTRGIWRDEARFEETYFSMYPGVWRHGDWARVDADGQWFLLGRSDEAINVAGKRVGPAEVETVLCAHPAVREAAVVGVPDEVTGEALVCLWVPVDEAAPDASDDLGERVVAALGRPFRPRRVLRVPALPRTRSAKILRRAIRAVAVGEDPGELTTAENPESLDAIRDALG
jgi:acetyl-CoA synthetase